MSTKVLSMLAVALFGAMSLFAADEAAGEKGKMPRFDSRIDTWVEGDIKELSADGKKFTINGTKMPYATVHAQMMQEFHKEAEGLDQAKRREKFMEVRKEWSDRLEKARGEEEGKPADFTFEMPAKGSLSVYQARDPHEYGWLRGKIAAKAGVDLKEEQPIPTAADKKEEGKEAGEIKFTDLKLNNHVLVGYDSGVLTNEAYVIIRGEFSAIKADRPAK